MVPGTSEGGCRIVVEAGRVQFALDCVLLSCRLCSLRTACSILLATCAHLRVAEARILLYLENTKGGTREFL